MVSRDCVDIFLVLVRIIFWVSGDKIVKYFVIYEKDLGNILVS